ncbi:MAG TPA: hypothetical protein VGF39_17735 [Stellaceae bacterium]
MAFPRLMVFAATALSLLCTAANAAGPYRPFQVGLWSGGAYTDDRTGGFSHCSAGVVYDGGINLFVVNTEAHGWWLGFTSPNWTLTPSTGIPVKLQFDGRPPVEVLGTIADGKLLLVPLPENSHLIDTFHHSSKIGIIAQERTVSLSLAAVSGALSELVNCVRVAVALDTPAQPPPTPAVSAPPQIPRALTARDATELEEINLARNFLLAAGLSNAQLIEADKPSALASFRAVWRSENAAGAVKIIPSGRDMTAVGIASELISVDPQLCKGNFTAMRSRDNVDDNIVYRAVLSCADGRNDRTAQYFVRTRKKGGFVVFAVIGDNAADHRAATDGHDADPFARAVVEAVGPDD